MNQKNFHSYPSHCQSVIGELFTTGESSDVTLICDDLVKFKAHKFVLKACSPVFRSILGEMNDSNSIVFLRGINCLELRPVLEYIRGEYPGFLIPIICIFYRCFGVHS